MLRRCLFPKESALQSASPTSLRAPHESIHESTPAIDDASLTSATRTPAFSHAPFRTSRRGALCRRRARENRFRRWVVVHREARIVQNRSPIARSVSDRYETGFGSKQNISRRRKISQYWREAHRSSPVPVGRMTSAQACLFVMRRRRAVAVARARVAKTTVSRRTLAICSSASRRA